MSSLKSGPTAGSGAGWLIATVVTAGAHGHQLSPPAIWMPVYLLTSGLGCRQHLGEADPRIDPDLVVDLAQVVLDSARGDEQLGSDLWVRQSVGGHVRNLGLLRRQVVLRLDVALAGTLAGREQLHPRAFREERGPERLEQIVGGAQMRPGVDTPTMTPQPFTVQQVGASEFGRDLTRPR